MNYIQWLNDYNIGIPEIDAQHRHLAELINELAQAQKDKKDASIHGKVLTELVNYTRIHFRDEEALMKKIDFPQLHEHEAQHKVLINQVVDILNTYKHGHTDITDKVLEILNHWLIKHILKQDKEIANYMENR